MQRIISCFTNSYGRAGVRAAVEHIRAPGSSISSWRCGATTSAAWSSPNRPSSPRRPRTARSRRSASTWPQHGVKISGCNVGGADIRTRDGLELDRAPHPVRGPMVRRARLRDGCGPAGGCRRAADGRGTPAAPRQHGGRTGPDAGARDSQGTDPERRGHAGPDGRGGTTRTSASISTPAISPITIKAPTHAPSSSRSSTWSGTSI